MLSLAMIVRNEARTIERAVASVREHVDEVVIGVDTRSDDGTLEIAKRIADKVIDTHLTDELAKKGPIGEGEDWGFSRARNAVFDNCKKDNWRLILDGHETILNPEKMQAAIEAAKVASSDGIEIWMHFEPSNNIPQTMFSTTRLMAPTVRYANSIHNVPVVYRPYSARHIIVEHKKSEQAQKDRDARNKQRSEANITALRNKVRVDGDDARSWFYLATAYKENARYAEAVKAFEECLRFSRWHEERWHARVDMGTCHNLLGDREKAREQYVLALEEHPARAEAYHYLADLAYKQNQFREAEVWLKKCVELAIPDCRLFVNPRIYMVDRHDLFSMTYFHIGRYDLAIEQAEEALKVAPNARIENNIKIWKNHLAKTVNKTTPVEALGSSKKIVHYCEGMSFFGKRLESIYGFSRYDARSDLRKAVLFLGLYFQEDYELFKKHEGRINVFWNGSDVLRMLNNPQWRQIIVSKTEVKHFCHNQQLQSELATVGISADIHPIFFGDASKYKPSFRPSKTPHVYLVAHPHRELEYGVSTVLEIAPKLPDITFHVYGIDSTAGAIASNVKFHGQVDEDVMDSEIVNFQGCLRLNKHDGFSQTVMKSILLAQYPICRNVPEAMVVESDQQIVERLNELKNQTEPNLKLREKYVGQFTHLPALYETKASAEYWEARYCGGGSSGSGSSGKLAKFKAETINNFVKEHKIQAVLDLGCGDGGQSSLFEIPVYVGIDTSQEAINRCSKKFEADRTKKFLVAEHPTYSCGEVADLVVSLDVIFHLVEDDVYFAYMDNLFNASRKFVIIYSSDFDRLTAPHERERKFTSYVETKFPQWKLVSKIDNPWPFPEHPDGSQSNFYIYELET